MGAQALGSKSLRPSVSVLTRATLSASFPTRCKRPHRPSGALVPACAAVLMAENGVAAHKKPRLEDGLHHAHTICLVLDFGSQYTQLIARRVRENSVMSIMLPGDVTLVRPTGFSYLQNNSKSHLCIGPIHRDPYCDAGPHARSGPQSHHPLRRSQLSAH